MTNTFLFINRKAGHVLEVCFPERSNTQNKNSRIPKKVLTKTLDLSRKCSPTNVLEATFMCNVERQSISYFGYVKVTH